MKYIRRDLINFKPYHAESESGTIKLDANESPYGLSDNVKKKYIDYIQNIDNINRYPNSDSSLLRKTLADFWGYTPSNFICGVGSDQIIDYITKAFLEPEDLILMQKPSFSVYKLAAELNHGKYKEIEIKNSFQTDICDIIEAVHEFKPKILFLCTPNNPTGISINQTDLHRALNDCGCIVVVDEAYAEFSNESMMKFLNEYDNLIILRTFSKAYGLAGARVGYAAANSLLIDCLNIVKAPYNLPSTSEMLAVYVIEEIMDYNKNIEQIIMLKNNLLSELKNIENITVYNSDANFVFIESSFDLCSLLKQHGISARGMGCIEGKYRTRLTSGTEEQNKMILNIIRSKVSGK